MRWKRKLRSFINIGAVGLSLGLLFFTSLTPVRAQNVPCNCMFVAYCDPAKGGAFQPAAISTCGPSSNELCTAVCAGIRIDPTQPANATVGGQLNCYMVSACGAKAGCSPCAHYHYNGADAVPYPAVPPDESLVQGMRVMCESGAYCGHYFPTTKGTPIVYSGEAGLYSDLFKQCFCSYGGLVQVIVNIGYTVVGTLALVMLAVGGWKYIMARNDPEKIAEAKGTLSAAVAGLIFVLFSIAILRFMDVQFSPWGIRFLVF